MKKKLFVCLLALALLVAVAAFAVQAETQVDTCPHCQKAMDQITWTSWSFTGGEIAGGHYYLAREYVGQTGMINIPEGVDVCLDLRGATYFAQDIHPFDIYGTLTVMDSGKNGQFVTTGKNGNSGGFAKIKESGTLNILGGTIRRVVKEGISIYTGGLVYVEKGTMKMSGGALVGGVAQGGGEINAQGGNIFMKGGSFEFTGGTISGGMAFATGTLKAQGGNLFVSQNATVTIDGGVIKDGYSDQDGGNIFISAISLTMKSGSITGGHAVRHGGNIAQINTEETTSVSLLGGTVSGGVAGGVIKNISEGAIARGSGGGGNYYSYCAKGSLTVANCTIGGDMKLDQIKSVTLSGATKIGLGKANGLVLPTAPDMDVTGLTEGAEVFVNASDVFTTEIPEADAQRIAGYFKGAIRTTVSLEGNTLKGTQGTTGYCPHCYDPANPQTVTWANRIAAATDGQHCYIASASNIGSKNTQPSTTTILDLNGYTINREGARLVLSTADKSYIVLDSFGGGKLEGTGTGNAYGGLVYLGGKNATFELYSGTVRLCAPATAADNIVKLGGVIYASAEGAKVIQRGGVIADGVVVTADGTGGGNVYLSGTKAAFEMEGGIVKSGNVGTKKGGNIYLAKGTAEIKGGWIVNGVAADGGNIYAAGDVTISGGTVYGGKVTDNTSTTDVSEGKGGNIYSTAETTVSGGTVSGGNARIGGNIYSSGSLEVSNTGVICAGVAATNGGNAYITGTVDMTGGTVTAGCAQSGGNFYFYADGKTSSFSGGLVTSGMAQTSDNNGKGGNIYISKGSVDVSDKAVISRGIANYGGGNVYAVSTLNVSGGQLLGGRTSTSTKDGGNVYLASGGVLNLSGGELSGGYASDCGGNIYMSNTNSKLNMTSGTITGGYAYKYGGNVCLNNGIMNMTGGTVSKGRGGRGGNFCLMFYASSTATIGGEGNPQIIDGTAIAGEGGNILFMDQAHQPNSEYSPHTTAPWLAIGKCTIEGGKAASFGNDIYINKYAYLRMLDSFDGELAAYFHDYQLPTEQLYGGMLAAGVTATGDFSGKLILENMDSRPFLLHKDGGLQVAAAAAVKNGVYTWFVDNAAMMAAYDATSDYMLAASGELVLDGGTYTVDLAGNHVNITGNGAVYGMDSANDTYDATLCGSATFGTGIKLAGMKAAADGKTYFAVQDGNSYTFHRGGMDITSVSIRPSAAGMYYSALWQSDKILADKIDAFGVAVSLVETPGDDFVEKNNTLYTQQEGFENGVTGNGVLISGILKNDRVDLNSAYAKMPIYAAAYITMDGENYTGAAESYSLHSMLDRLSDEIYEYYSHAEKLQSFMDQWDDFGLTGADWDMNFDVPQAIVDLQTLYAGTNVYQGELHDHADTGGTSDGHNTLNEWLDGMKKLDMDFAAIVDHKQYLHMELPEWDNQYFIGGTELAVGVSDLAAATQNKAHINIIFYDPMDLKAAIEEYDAYDTKGGFKAQWYAEDYSGTDAEKLAGGWHFEYLFGATAPTKADMAKLVEIVKKHNGVFVHVHPKSSSYIKSTDPLDYWFADYTGLEVYYTVYSDRTSTATKNNYKLWTDLLKLGKKVWATAGNDEHAAPANKALSTIYSTKQDAKEFVERVAVGNFTAGHVGVQMVVGDQVMGYETDFNGKDLAFRVGDFHSSVYDSSHEYKAVLVADETVVKEWSISCEKPFYYSQDADPSVNYYRVEVYDVTTGEMLALGNPIWNTAAN